MTVRRVAVIDVGKTNVKLAVVELTECAETVIRTRPNRVLPAPPWPHFDIEGIWDFLLDALAVCRDVRAIDAVSVTAHGGAVVLVDAAGSLAAPVLDYEHPIPDEAAAAYDQLRPDFAETASPRLAGGLNIGAQLHWQFSVDAGLRARTASIVTYPQYWGFRLTGELATDVTSLGCHTDLWEPYSGRLSKLADRLGVRGKMAPPRPPQAVLGHLRPEVRRRTGLGPDIPVHCGIHDSNASLLPHVLARKPPFTVVSTGTWFVVMAVGGSRAQLDPERDTLVNVNALGQPVPSARFMGGREFELIAGAAPPAASPEEAAEALARPFMLLPAVVTETGPFRGRAGGWAGAEPDADGRRTAAASFYLALMTMRCLDLVGHAGDVIVEGPLARNRLFLDMLAAAGPARVLVATGVTGTSVGAALLAAPKLAPPPRERLHPPPAQRRAFRDYAAAWNRLVPDR